MNATTPREALKYLEFDNGGDEKVVLASPDAILTALAPFLRTAGTVEVCERWPSVHCSDHPNSDAGRSLCTQRTCPHKQVANEKD